MTNIAGATAIMLGGPGRHSLDRALGIKVPAWIAPLGLVVIVLTVLYGHRRGSEETPQQQDEAREDLAGEEG